LVIYIIVSGMHGHKNIPSANLLFSGIIYELTLFSTLAG